ncbi:hypothetical protein SPRG_10034 [Saprolegnia parasitica CBS 223.65]|uniref:PX domain-containing protein n=1 Tax=Saprolegnia parasitica (strain CBS 223.65) TaxID=695850 RepID=A0A067BZC7_SAPPC|nr:hypothetical protein SPRG_10034 [Saprolegnia parasitica CBS 223.65]KDO23889.1 hypothetical protein SPRG_10034 [Saprolegnia parasitica CBS 223.65]|eukprot:XP_012205359.1 hypothetical protein SPRG_10034 [Saprolegnia parasitica CBS 223.65]
MGCQQSTPVRDPQPVAAVDLTNKSLSTIGDALQEDTAEKWAVTVQRVKSNAIPEEAKTPLAAQGMSPRRVSVAADVVSDHAPVAAVVDDAIAENDAALATIADALADDVADKWEALVHEVEISRSAPVSATEKSPAESDTTNLAAVADENAAVPPAMDEAADEDSPMETTIVQAEGIDPPAIVIDEVEMEVIMIAPLHDGDTMDTVVEELSEVDVDVVDATDEATDNETVDVVEESTVVDEEEVDAAVPMPRSTVGQEYVLDDLIGSTVPVHTRVVAAGIVDEIIESAVARVNAKETVEVDIDAEMDAEQKLLQVQHDLAEIAAELEQIKEASEKIDSTNESDYIGNEIAPQDEPVPQSSDATTADIDNPMVPKAPSSKAPSSKAPSSKSKHYKSLGSSVESGIVMYNVQVPSGRVIHKRYNDFKVLYSDMAHVMLVNDVHGGGGLPPMPRAGMMSRFTRQNKAMVQEREQVFESILNAIAEHPIASHSPEFQHFLR